MSVYYLVTLRFSVTKTKQLKNEVGTGKGDNLIWHKAKDLHGKANTLAEAEKLKAQPGQTDTELKKELRKLAESLKNAVGENELASDSLQQALSELSTATANDPRDLITKAEDVIKHYDDVTKKYKTVTVKSTEYTGALGGAEQNKYTEVTSQFGLLQDIGLLYVHGHTNLTDLNTGGTAQTGLATKAATLKEKATALNGAANAIVTEAAKDGSPLKDLSGPATQLKDAAKNGSNGLFEKAQALAGNSGGDASEQADGVIDAFDAVEKKYEALMKKAETNKLTNDERVIEVVKEFHAVKTTYYQMLITYRIKKKATLFHQAASKLQTEAKGAGPDTPLKALQSNASSEMGNLVQKADKLQRINVGTESDANIVSNYLKVEGAYIALETMKQFKAAEGVPQVKTVKTKFDALKKSYVNVLKLRIQELATLAQDLYTKADTLSAVNELQSPANALRDAASHTSGGLKEKAESLATSISVLVS
uniref:Uncharacterized protein n=1 Tax=Theileria annulata TaxID=5874 RepID=A0A3B0MHZ3_THEAN